MENKNDMKTTGRTDEVSKSHLSYQSNIMYPNASMIKAHDKNVSSLKFKFIKNTLDTYHNNIDPCPQKSLANQGGKEK